LVTAGEGASITLQCRNNLQQIGMCPWYVSGWNGERSVYPRNSEGLRGKKPDEAFEWMFTSRQLLNRSETFQDKRTSIVSRGGSNPYVGVSFACGPLLCGAREVDPDQSHCLHSGFSRLKMLNSQMVAEIAESLQCQMPCLN
jgi:hypothetical protein